MEAVGKHPDAVGMREVGKHRFLVAAGETSSGEDSRQIGGAACDAPAAPVSEEWQNTAGAVGKRDRQASATGKRSAGRDASDMNSRALALDPSQASKLAFDKKGCRLVQLALDVSPRQKLDALVNELSGHMVKMMGSPHANFVARKVIEVMPAEKVGAVFMQFKGQVVRVACHEYGCRIVIAFFQHCINRPECASLVEELLSKTQDMFKDTYGHYVLEGLLEHGNEELKHHIFSDLSDPANFVSIAQHKHASYVVRAALTHCSDADVSVLCDRVTDHITDVTATTSGCYLYKALCESSHTREKALAALRRHISQDCPLHQALASQSWVKKVLPELAGSAEAPVSEFESQPCNC